jgi:hypothetical protein
MAVSQQNSGKFFESEARSETIMARFGNIRKQDTDMQVWASVIRRAGILLSRRFPVRTRQAFVRTTCAPQQIGR